MWQAALSSENIHTKSDLDNDNWVPETSKPETQCLSRRVTPWQSLLIWCFFSNKYTDLTYH